jgi:hypothetical protein
MGGRQISTLKTNDGWAVTLNYSPYVRELKTTNIPLKQVHNEWSKQNINTTVR